MLHFIHQHYLAIIVCSLLYLALLTQVLMFNYGANMCMSGNPSIAEALERRRLEKRHAKQLAAA